MSSEDINKVILIGRLVRDAELSYTRTGFALCKFDLAVNRRKKQWDQWVDEVSFFSINLWGRRGESLNQYLPKGTQVGIEGALRQQRWEQDGLKRSKVIVEAVNVELLGGNREGSGNSRPAQAQRPQGQHSTPPKNGHNQHGSMANRPNQARQRPAQSGGADSYQDYTPPDYPNGSEKYEDDIPF